MDFHKLREQLVAKGYNDPTFAWIDVPANDATKAITDYIATL